MIKINAATINPSVIGKKIAKKVKNKHPAIKKVYMIADFKRGSFFANPSLYTTIVNAVIVIHSNQFDILGLSVSR